MSKSTSSLAGHPEEYRSFAGSKWRGKLFASERIFKKSLEQQQSNEQDLAYFLQRNPSKPGEAATERVGEHHIDTGTTSKLPYASGDLDIAPPENIYHKAKPRNNKGHQVRFVASAPEIIGEGGDQAEAPPTYVARKKVSKIDTTLTGQKTLQTTSTGRSKVVGDKLLSASNEPEYEDATTVSADTLEKHDWGDRRLRDPGDFFPGHWSRNGHHDPVSPLSTCSDNAEVGPAENNTKSPRSSMLLKQPPRSEIDTYEGSLTLSTSPSPSSMLPGASSPARCNQATSDDGQASRKMSAQPSLRLRQESSAAAADGKTKPISLRDVARNIGLDALDDFDIRVRRFDAIFLLGVTVGEDPMRISLGQWIRAAMWWFLKGRGELELAVRSRRVSTGSQSPSMQRDIGTDLKQAYLDLAKARWIIRDITANHPDTKRLGDVSAQATVPIIQSLGNRTLASLVETRLSLIAHMRALTMSMKRNGRLPSDTFEIGSLNARVLYESPRLPESVGVALSNSNSRSTYGSATHSLPLGDTDRYFTFCRAFGTGSLTSRNRSWDTVYMPCIVSITRAKDSLNLTAMISNQDCTLDITIGAEKTKDVGLTWKDVRWSGSDMHIYVSTDIDLCIQMMESDFKALRNICDYIRKVKKDFQGRDGEELLFENGLDDFQCLQSKRHPSSFPTDPVKSCRTRLFAKTRVHSDSVSHRRIYAGHRLMVTTPPQAKSLNSVSQQYGDGLPTIIGLGQREGEPKLALRVPHSSQLLLTFKIWDDLDFFYNTLTQRRIFNDEAGSALLTLQAFSIALIPSEDRPLDHNDMHIPDHRWQHVEVISPKAKNCHPHSTQIEHPQQIRIIAQCEQGILTDPINLGKGLPSIQESELTQSAPGELQISLSVNNCNEIKLLRPPQPELSLTLTDHGLSDRLLESWEGMLRAIGRSANVKSYHFQSLSGADISVSPASLFCVDDHIDLHTFEAMVTGFNVAFDGYGTTTTTPGSQLTPCLNSFVTHFAISRPRKGVPIHKQWEADAARIQLLRQDKTIQLLAFFKDFSHGTCMNFVLNATDNYETVSKAGGYFVRLVDAKFALPKRNGVPMNEFLCLDIPEYPGEDDDILIGFQNETASLKTYTVMATDTNGIGVIEHVAPPQCYNPPNRYDSSTLAVHADDILNEGSDVAPAFHVSSTFRYATNPNELVTARDLKTLRSANSHIYSRETAPNSTRLEALLQALLTAQAVTYTSGLAALHAAYVFLKPKKISIGGGYHGSHGVLALHTGLTGAKVLALDCNAQELGKGDVIHLETPVNPTGEALSIRKFAGKAHSRGAYLLVDATFGPPGLQEPFSLGADLVMHSGTKYLGGHSDMLCGVLASRNQEWARGLKEQRTYLGSVLGNMEAWLGIRSVRTLTLRVERQSASATNLVSWLDSLLKGGSHGHGVGDGAVVQQVVEKVHHASLQHLDMKPWLKEQMPNGFGPVFAITMKREDLARRLPSKSELFHHATSLGGVESLIEWRAMSDDTVDRRLVRVSIGVEDWVDLREDLMRGFRALHEQVV
ncbi:MAG: hypothetical protein Q9163_002496 [Psora crenata]